MSLYRVRIGKNGRITIPIEIRRQLGLQTGDMLILETINGAIHLRKATQEELDKQSGQQSQR